MIDRASGTCFVQRRSAVHAKKKIGQMVEWATLMDGEEQKSPICKLNELKSCLERWINNCHAKRRF